MHDYLSSSLTLELSKVRDQIRRYAEDYGLDFFETIFEMVDSDQINSLASQSGLSRDDLLQGLSQSEIAARLNMPLGTVKSFMRRGLIKVRELMNIATEGVSPRI